jgi:dTDP-glucose 4,6-dehydratase
MERMLVTGGAGFIGANFVRRALAADPDRHITVVDALTYAGELRSLDGLERDVRFVHGDICDAALMDSLIRDMDVVVHFAAESHVDSSLDDPAPFLRTNVQGTFTILEALRRHGGRLHHVSTDEVFGDLPLATAEMFTETTRYDPSSPYSATKAASDLLVRAWVRSYGISATLSNCANNYGPYQNVEKFLPRQITNVLDGGRPKLYGAGCNVREWTHVDDHNDAVLAIVERGRIGETYLIGSGTTRTNKEMLETLLPLLGRPADGYDLVPDRPGHDLKYANDSSKIRAELGWRPRYDDLAAGLAAIIEWYRSNEKWWRPQKNEVEARYAAWRR